MHDAQGDPGRGGREDGGEGGEQEAGHLSGGARVFRRFAFFNFWPEMSVLLLIPFKI